MLSNIELIVVKNAMAYSCDSTDCKIVHGDDLFTMISDIYPNGQPLNTYWYQDNWDTANDVTPEYADDINALNEQGGTIYVVTYPADPVTLAIVAVSVLVSVAVTFLMPMSVGTAAGSPSAPPSPNNALAQRTNRQRLGGRVPAIFGEVWSVPDLIAQTYSIYIDHEQIEYSDMCIGEGYYNITAAKDDNTAIGLVAGANVRIYNPGINTYNQDPTVEFGNSLTPDEQQYDNYSTRRYSSVNGQVLAVPENYLICDNNVVFETPNIVKIISGTGFDITKFAVGETLQIEDASRVLTPSGNTYNLSGFYQIASTSSTQLTLTSPELVNRQWTTLASTDTQTNASSPVLSTEARPLWQGWHYINDNDVNIAIMNFLAPQGIYTTHLDGDKFAAFEIGLIVEVQGLDDKYQPYPDNIAKFDYAFKISGRTAKLNAQGTAYTFTTSEEARLSAALTQTIALFGNPGGSRLRVRRNSRRQSLGTQFFTDEVKFVDLYSAKFAHDASLAISNNATRIKTKTKATEGATALKERRLMVLVSRKTKGFTFWSGKITDMYATEVNGYPRIALQLSNEVDFKGLSTGVLFVKTKKEIIKTVVSFLFTDGAYSKYHVVLPSNFIQDNDKDKQITIDSDYYFSLGDPSTDGDPYFDYSYIGEQGLSRLARLESKRIDEIIYHIATSQTTGGLSPDDLNMVQITAEVDAQIAYFGTDLCAQFCGTFDSVDISTEEMIQTVASAGFFTAYRINNKIHLHFERPESLPVATFNSHNILPDTFEYSESFGPRNGFDGVEVTWTDPRDDAKVTLSYPSDNSAINPQKIELVGVRNKVQAHMHMMRAHYKNQYAYSTCSFTGADESGIVIPTNRINVANQQRADTQQGVVDSLQVNSSGQTVLVLSGAVDFGTKTQAAVFVQTVSATVDSINCTPGARANEIILSRAPNQPISTAWDAVVRATYQLVLHDDLDRDSYLVTAKEVGSNPLSHMLTCINYDARYYQNDNDYKTNNIFLD